MTAAAAAGTTAGIATGAPAGRPAPCWPGLGYRHAAGTVRPTPGGGHPTSACGWTPVTTVRSTVRSATSPGGRHEQR